MLSITEYINESISIEEKINEGIIKDTATFLKDNIKKIAVSAAVAASILNPASVKAVNIDASSSESPQVVTAQVMNDVHKTGDVPPGASGIAKSNANYKQVMTEMATTENLIASYRENYNNQVKSYNNYIRKFPSNIISGIMGYKKINYNYLDYKVSSDSPKNLWD